VLGDLLMHRLLVVLGSAILLALWSGPAAASGDFSCTPSWKLVHPDRTECDNIAILGPGNDTRVNLAMLLVDRHGGRALPPGAAAMPQEALFEWETFRDQLSPVASDASSDAFAYGEGSRCRSNSAGAAAFINAVAAARLPGEEPTFLGAARGELRPDCAGKSNGAAVVTAISGQVKSKPGRAFIFYLEGAFAFYDGDYGTAAARFGSLRSAKDAWLRETALYMLARVEVNRAQIDAFDEYGFPVGPDHIDQKVVDAAEQALKTYLSAYPRGRYAISARGLLRRVYWLGGRAELLAAQYAATIALDPAERGLDDGELSQEIDSKLLPGMASSSTHDPTLLAVLDLLNMRPCDASRMACENALTAERLEAQREAFAANPKLFDYLLAVFAFYRSDQPEEVLRLISETTAGEPLSYLEFSRQMLRRMALERLGRGPDTAAWLALLPRTTLPYQRAALELAIARHYERSGALARVFDPDSPVRIASLRETLLMMSADATLLRARATDPSATGHERSVALFTLLYKELSHGAYRGFVTDLKLVPDDATREGWFDFIGSESVPLGLFTQDEGSDTLGCPPVREIAAGLARTPNQPAGRLCLAEFMRLNGFDYMSIDSAPARDELGGTPSLFAGAPYSRLEVYKSVIADPKAPADDKAYALYRAVNCYAPTGHNSCSGTDVPVDQRGAWFNRLKKDYPASPWAKELKYYW
jgi:hypothetical protein